VSGAWVSTACRLALGAVWIWAGVAKAADPFATLRSVRAYQLLPEGAVQVVAFGLPFFEIALGGLLVLGLLVRPVAVASLVVLGLFTAAIASARAARWRARGRSRRQVAGGHPSASASRRTSSLSSSLRSMLRWRGNFVVTARTWSATLPSISRGTST